MSSKSGWKELKRDVPDHMAGTYAMDKKIYWRKGVSQDVDWNFCVEYPKNTRFTNIPHVNPCIRMPKLITTRDTKNCYVSKKFGDHKKDWDYLVNYWNSKINRAEVYVPKNLPLVKKIQVIVNDIAIAHEIKDGRYLHMIDVIDKGGWCTGQGAAIAAIANTLGLESRAIIIFKRDGAGHTNGEIRINGKWLFCENIDYCHGDICVHLMDKSWIEVWSDPDACKNLPEEQKKYYRNVYDFLYDYSIGLNWHMSTIGSFSWVRFTPESAKALYPEMDKFPAKFLTERSIDASGRMLLEPGFSRDDGHGWDNLCFQKVEQGQGIRRNLYLSSLKGVKSISSHLTMVKNITINPKSSDWYIRINGGKKYYLKGLDCRMKYSGDSLFHGGVWWKNEKKIPKEVKKWLDLGWHWHQGKKKENQLCFRLPLEALKQNSLNTIELLSDNTPKGNGGECFHVRLYDNPTLPVPKPYKS
ncbi:MAG: hypothetical protein A2297_03595 [Elusimicrobia bacterium RIFOXYB2_FULL_48_7]|nr:MAG: hypothetical protein A2297_03595 [Elusimicrobia bacterium RIFOXYB2_FULL_48_7]